MKAYGKKDKVEWQIGVEMALSKGQGLMVHGSMIASNTKEKN